MRRPVLAALVASLLFGCATTGASSSGVSADQGSAPTSADKAQATDFSLRSTDGSMIRLSDFLGKDVVLLSFWATWCVPCNAEMPQLQKLHEKYKDQGLTILGVSMDGPESVANVEPTIRRNGVNYPILLDEETRVAAVYDPTKDAPYTVLIGRDGRVVEAHLGYTPGDEVKLEQQIQALLAEAPSAKANQ